MRWLRSVAVRLGVCSGRREYGPAGKVGEFFLSFADADLEEVVRDALDVDAREALTCDLLSGLKQLVVPSDLDRVVYGETLRPARSAA